MKQRLGIAGALLRDPKLLLLDEPTTGLDPAGMRDMRELVRRLAEDGLTVLLSSHLMAEVEELCNRVAIVRSGAILYEGALDELIARPTASRDGSAPPTTPRAAAIAAAARDRPRAAATAAPRADGGDEARSSHSRVELGEAGIGIRALSTARDRSSTCSSADRGRAGAPGAGRRAAARPWRRRVTRPA